MQAIITVLADLIVLLTAILLITHRVHGIVTRILYISVVITMCVFVAAYAMTCASKGRCDWTGQEFKEVAYCTLRPDQCTHLLPKFGNAITAEYWKRRALAQEDENKRLRAARVQAAREAAEARRRTREALQRRQTEERRQVQVEQRHATKETARPYGERRPERSLFVRRSHYGATAVGRYEPTRGLHAVSYVNQLSMRDATSKALAQCNRVASNCRIIARFSGRGRCVFVAGGGTTIREFNRIRHRVGARAAGIESEAMQKCYSVFQRCRVFHRRCNR